MGQRSGLVKGVNRTKERIGQGGGLVKRVVSRQNEGYNGQAVGHADGKQKNMDRRPVGQCDTRDTNTADGARAAYDRAKAGIALRGPIRGGSRDTQMWSMWTQLPVRKGACHGTGPALQRLRGLGRGNKGQLNNVPMDPGTETQCERPSEIKLGGPKAEEDGYGPAGDAEPGGTVD